MKTQTLHPSTAMRTVALVFRRTALAGLLTISATFAAQAAEAAKEPAKDAAPAAETAVTSPTSPQAVIARVNGTPITAGERDHQATILVYQQLSRFGQNIASLPPEAMESLRGKAKEAALTQLINVNLVKQFKEKNAVDVEPKAVDARIDQLKEMLKKRDTTYEEYLKAKNRTDADIRKELTSQLQIEQLLEKRTGGKLEPNDEQMKEFYDSNKKEFDQPEMIRSSHILFKFPGDPRDPAAPKPTDAEKAEVRKKAEEVLAKIKAGGDFAEMAKQFGQDGTAQKGGDLGLHPKGRMVKPFEDAEWALKVGELSGIVESQFGYHIIKVTEKKEAGTLKYDEVKDSIHDYLVNQRFTEAMENLLEELNKNGKIEILEKQATTEEAAPAKAAPAAPANPGIKLKAN